MAVRIQIYAARGYAKCDWWQCTYNATVFQLRDRPVPPLSEGKTIPFVHGWCYGHIPMGLKREELMSQRELDGYVAAMEVMND